MENAQRFDRQGYAILSSRLIDQESIHLQVYDANSDRNSVIGNTLIQPIEARFIRIYPESWHGHMSMRMELYGCEIHSGKRACSRCNYI